MQINLETQFTLFATYTNYDQETSSVTCNIARLSILISISVKALCNFI